MPEPVLGDAGADEPVVLVTTDGPCCRVVFNRPNARNALSASLLTGLRNAIDQAESDPDVTVFVISGRGPVFCAGADLKEPREVAARAPRFSDIVRSLMTSSMTVLAVLNGPARAGGIGLVAAADIAIAADDVTFAFPEVQIGVVPAVISVPCARVVQGRALTRYCLTGEVFGAADAVAAGLLTAAAPAGRLGELEASILEALVLASPRARAGTKELLRSVPALSLEPAFAYMDLLSARYFAGPDAAEGRLAFVEKRAPRWPAPGIDSR